MPFITRLVKSCWRTWSQTIAPTGTGLGRAIRSWGQFHISALSKWLLWPMGSFRVGVYRIFIYINSTAKLFNLIGLFTHLKLCLADVIHNFKWVKIIQIWQNGCQRFWNIVDWCHTFYLQHLFSKWRSMILKSSGLMSRFIMYLWALCPRLSSIYLLYNNHDNTVRSNEN